MHRNNRASIVRFIYIYCVLYQLYNGFASVKGMIFLLTVIARGKPQLEGSKNL